MKWFKHDSDMHTNLKIQELIDRQGAEGYAVWCLCLEFMAKEGKRNRIDGQKRWKKGLIKVLQWSDEGRLNPILETLAEVKLINSKSLKYGNLHIPSFSKRADNYTKYQLKSIFKDSYPRIDKNRIDKIIREYIREKGWVDYLEKNPFLKGNVFQRNLRPAKELIIIANDDTKAIKAISVMAKEYKEKKLDWTLETVIKHYVKMSGGEVDDIPEELRQFVKKE